MSIRNPRWPPPQDKFNDSWLDCYCLYFQPPGGNRINQSWLDTCVIHIAGEIDKINQDKIELKKEMDISRVNVLCRKISNDKEYVQFLNSLYLYNLVWNRKHFS